MSQTAIAQAGFADRPLADDLVEYIHAENNVLFPRSQPMGAAAQ